MSLHQLFRGKPSTLGKLQSAGKTGYPVRTDATRISYLGKGKLSEFFPLVRYFRTTSTGSPKGFQVGSLVVVRVIPDRALPTTFSSQNNIGLKVDRPIPVLAKTDGLAGHNLFPFRSIYLGSYSDT